MFTLVTGIVGRWRAVCVTALQRPNSDAAAIRIVVWIAAALFSVKVPLECTTEPHFIPGVPNSSPQGPPTGHVFRISFALHSGSMEPAFHRGDLLFLTNRVDDPIRVGEIVVFRIEGREIPIVHRVLKIHEKDNGDIKFLTKGDNNAVDDRGLYKQGQNWLEKKDVVGRARGFVPYIGIVTILMNDYPKFKL
ncbi:unnamed protein product [Ranitomeya imitator]|uniref:Signal peptidase complex catalytic subunit SEC11 n=1 Tax=Ranitomeya imitator TaxID=111125 RepID=A0ABN9LZ54_9NEOB|nr:unnamed protein product [Ranitomeya imitator]